MLHIDGAAGEGGGQVLRSALALAGLTGQSVHIDDVRGGRKKPGVLRQHAAAIRAAVQVCRAEVDGGEVGSRSVRFRPESPRGGTYAFRVGTAGSTVLVLQTVLPLLLRAPEASEVTVEGGTHNPLAPPYPFLEQVFVPALHAMGASVTVELLSHGFAPAGGGAIRMQVQPGPLAPFVRMDRPDNLPTEVTCTISGVPFHVARRELNEVARAFPGSKQQVRDVKSPGPGNVLTLAFGRYELVSAFGAKGVPAERVAQDLIAEARDYEGRLAPVGEHLADQLLLPLALGGGRFVTGSLSRHAETNLDLVRRFLGNDALTVTQNGPLRTVSASGPRL